MDEDGLHKTITKLFFDRPNKELEELYLTKKEEHMEKFYASIHHQLMEEDKKADEGNEPNVKCDACGYEWKSKSQMKKKHCPSCDLKSSTTNIEL